ncbi:FUSC family protein [Paenarthrobacter sp. Z7-10]|nr:FUSC family protein [Paenarthrobacter sp. Z7-10]
MAPTRLQLAGKAALAAGIAWFVAPLIPGPAAQYPYYAPFGALISMYPTVSSSLRQGLQSLVGLAAGIGLAFALVSIGKPNPVTVAIVVGVGMILSGIPRIGGGKDWIPTAALFVLVLGGADAESFSIGYLVQSGVGVGIGLAVNLLIFPPLRFNAAATSLEFCRLALAAQLEDMGVAITEKWPPEHANWSTRNDRLSEASRRVREAVSDADQSRKANPRRRLHRRNIGADYVHVRALERITFHVKDITEVLADAIWETPEETPVPADLCTPLGNALNTVGALVRQWNDEDAEAIFVQAKDSVDFISVEYDRLRSPEKEVAAAASITMSLKRILRGIRGTLPDVAPPEKA